MLAQPVPAPSPVEILPGLFVLAGSPDSGTFTASKSLGITHVINLRTPEEGDFGWEATAVQSFGGSYVSCPVHSEALPDGLDRFRALISSLPPTARILIHCASGNRAGAALFAFWSLDRAMAVEKAIALAKRAGLRNPTIEAVTRRYVMALLERSGPVPTHEADAH
jgi:protein tyrosine phosphatase (PTP) superfamily phosphohydrolase (DUF442 family)